MSELLSKTSRNNSLETLLDDFTRLKRDAYAKLDQALTVDQSNESHDTKNVLYANSLLLIDNALDYYNNNENKLKGNEDAVKIFKQLKEMKKMTTERLEYLKKTSPKVEIKIDDDFLNISDDVLLVDDDENDIIIIDSPNKNDKNKNDNLSLKDFEKATEIYHLKNGVQQFYIANDGTVSTPSHLTDISIYTFDKYNLISFCSKSNVPIISYLFSNLKEKNGKNIVGFIRIADWLYPLIPNESPGMKTSFNAFIFPNNDKTMNSDDNSRPELSFIGLTFAKGINDDQIMFFEDVLAGYGSLIYQEGNQSQGIKRPLINSATTDSLSINYPKLDNNKNKEFEKSKSKSENQINKSDKPSEEDEPKNSTLKSSFTAENIAKTLVTGAQYISRGVNSTTEYASKYMQQGGEKIVSSVTPNPEPAKVDPKVKSAVSTIRYGSHLTVRVSSFLVNKLKSIATSTAQTVAPHIREGSTYLLKQTGVASDKSSANNYIDNTCKVAGSAIQGFGIVYDSLEEAAKQLGRNFTEQSVTVVNHKYGPDAAKVTENGLYSVGNVAQSVNNFQDFKIMRTLAKATAKETLSSRLNKTNQDVNQNSELSSQSEKN